ncbi:CopG-family transcriptional regulator [Clostridium putrefaciens]|uniref:CopG-family transcriptional regulator n=1 Tax=Clostridium putrefaciens TaxID=99675 RepID=A0A381J4F4_9CLOT|nr:CopG family transcriptional regulator [Clostridium putrefaciens]SUY45862.1 CopG-family transcriptional regulator [Clostridium putrefaciens]
MSRCKRLMVTLSGILKDDKKNSQFIMRSVILYRDNENNTKGNMESGYLEMASINLEYSELGCECEYNECLEYETWLSESDLSNDNNSSKKRRYLLC